MYLFTVHLQHPLCQASHVYLRVVGFWHKVSYNFLTNLVHKVNLFYLNGLLESVNPHQYDQRRK
jgi:hypothetical protein